MGKLSFNGTGTFNINTTGQPVVTGTVISSSTFNLLTADLATGLTTCITKDGQSTPTANIPMGSYKLTGLGAPTTSGDALSFGNVATISTLTLTNPLGTASGGTGAASFTDAGVLIGNGAGIIQVTTAGTSGQVLTSNGAGVDPTFQAASGALTLVSQSTTLAAILSGQLYRCTGTFTATFQAASGQTSPWYTRFVNEGSGVITFARTGADTIDGLTTYALYPGEVRDFYRASSSAYISVVVAPFTAQFTASGTFVEPPGYTSLLLDGIGAGAGGGYTRNVHSDEGAGGGGGGRKRVHHQPTAGTSITITIGAGGAGGIASGPTAATAGGNTTYGSAVTFYGGGAGASSVSANGIGGGGGGGFGAGATGAASSGGQGGLPRSSFAGTTQISVDVSAVATLLYTANNMGVGGGAGVYPGSTFSTTLTGITTTGSGCAEWGGGGGGTAAASPWFNGGSSFFGGGGGGAGASNGVNAGGAGGACGSYAAAGGGAGGAAGATGVAGTAGTAGNLLTGKAGFGGGGGGGGSVNGGGAGGAGGVCGGGGGAGGFSTAATDPNGGAGGRGELVIYGGV